MSLEGEDDQPLLLKPTQVAQLLGLSRSKVFALLASGELPSVRIGGVRRVPRVHLEKLIAEQVRWEPRPDHGLLGRLTSATRR